MAKMDHPLLRVPSMNTWYLVGLVALWWVIGILAAVVAWPRRAASPGGLTGVVLQDERADVSVAERKLAA